MDHGEYRYGGNSRVSCLLLSCTSLQHKTYFHPNEKVVNLVIVRSFFCSAVTAYALEKYPEQSTVVSAILNMWRTCGGFAVGYFQPAWIARNGLGLVFGIQAIVVSVSVVLCIVPVLIKERRKSMLTAA